MLEHLSPSSSFAGRTVVIGAAGFVGAAIAARLAAAGVNVAGVTRQDVNLLAPDAATRLAALLRPGDAVLAAAARAPCKDLSMFIDNMVMVRTMLDAIGQVPVSHVVNISSDAVYPDEPLPLTETTPAAPTTLHGAMHLAREIAFQNSVTAPLAIVRPSLLYGAGDPHNGYGPNRFRRLAEAGEDIVLFGEGEERRDHVLIDDLAELVTLMLGRRSRGVLNVATGEVASFRSIAERVVALSGRSVAVKSSPRNGPMPHKGYRPFDPAACRAAFPDFVFTPLADGLAKAQSSARGGVDGRS